MFSNQDTFVQKCVRGEARLDEIDDFVELWHRSDDRRELHQFLGMDEQEYASWMNDSSTISSIVAARRSRTAA